MDVISIIFFLTFGTYLLFKVRKEIDRKKSQKESNAFGISTGSSIKIKRICGYGLIACAIGLLIIGLL